MMRYISWRHPGKDMSGGHTAICERVCVGWWWCGGDKWIRNNR